MMMGTTFFIVFVISLQIISNNSASFLLPNARLRWRSGYFQSFSGIYGNRQHLIETKRFQQASDELQSSNSGSGGGVAKKIELNRLQLWRLSISLEKEGCKSAQALCNIRFVEDRNYEPPQGRVYVEDDYNGFVKVDDRGYGGSWTLSEDKNDRKDGLWIWGLFEEPKYPFLYFSLGVYNSTILPSGEEEPVFGTAGDGIPNGRLDFRFLHRREPQIGSVLEPRGEMSYRPTEMMQADPFGIGGVVNVGEDVRAGTVTLTPCRPNLPSTK